jgi:hypothetical protein
MPSTNSDLWAWATLIADALRRTLTTPRIYPVARHHDSH